MDNGPDVNLDYVLTLILATSALGYALLAVRLWWTRIEVNRRVGTAFFLVALWAFAGVLQLRVGFPLLIEIGRVGHFVGAALLPLVVLIAFRSYTGHVQSIASIAALSAIPLASIAIAATNQLHGLMWVENIAPRLGNSIGVGAWGPWFRYVHAPYSYSLLAWSLSTILMHSTAVAPANRRNVRRLAVAVLLPSAALATHDFGYVPATAVPLTFALLLPVYALLMLRERVIEFAPLAYETVFQNMSDPVLVVDEHQRIIGMNQCAEDLLMVNETQALRTSLESVFGPDVPEVFSALRTGEPQKMMTNSGRFLHLQASPLKSDKHNPGGQVLMFRDVSDVEIAQREVRNSEKMLRTLIDQSVNGIVRLRWTSDSGIRQLRCNFANAAAGQFLHVNTDVMLKCSAEEIIQFACSGMSENEASEIVDKFVAGTTQGEVVDVETRVEAGDSIKWLRVIAEPVGDNVAVTFVDVTDRKAKEIHMESIAWSDPLTGVLNRRGFENSASRRLAASDDSATGALLFIDLNGFKQVNDSNGHEAGDELLKMAAERLRNTLRSCDIIGRPGGDEFVALVPDIASDRAEALAERLVQTLEKPYQLGNVVVNCSASIGLALYPEHANTLTGLLRGADQAMYRAKARSRDVTDGADRGLLEKAG